MSNFQTYADVGIKGINAYGTGEQRTTCPQCSASRQQGHQHIQCLAVNVEKKTWLCHHCGWHGGLKSTIAPSKPEWKPVQPKTAKKAPEGLQEWFMRERGISSEVLAKNRVEFTQNAWIEGKEQPAIAFNYYVGETLVNVKYRTKDKRFSQIKDGAQVLYGLNDIEKSDECVICEGEMDKLSFNMAGIWNAVSVPSGAPPETSKQNEKKMEFLTLCAPWLDNKNRVYLACDADAPGLRLRDELARRLGKARCWIVTYPNGCKDANDVLKKHGADAVNECLSNAVPYPVEGVFSANDFASDFYDLYEHGYPDGAKTGYKVFDSLIEFHKSQLTVITGVPSSGKSNFLDQVLVRLARNHGWKTGLFTPENYPIKVHLQRLSEILVGKPFLPGFNNRMRKDEAQAALIWLNSAFSYVQPENEEFTLDALLDRFAYLVAREGIDAAVIDPWNTIEHQRPREMSETEYIGKTLNRLKYFARNHGLHLFVVAHPTKVQKQADGMNYEIPNLYSIMGSSNWFNVVDNGIVVHRQYDKTGKKTQYVQVFLQKVKHRYMGQKGFSFFDFDISCHRYEESTKNDVSESENRHPYISHEQGFDSDHSSPF